MMSAAETTRHQTVANQTRTVNGEATATCNRILVIQTQHRHHAHRILSATGTTLIKVATLHNILAATSTINPAALQITNAAGTADATLFLSVQTVYKPLRIVIKATHVFRRLHARIQTHLHAIRMLPTMRMHKSV